MRIYALMEGYHREEVPTQLLFRRESAQQALDTAVVESPHTDPYVLAFSCIGMPVECDIAPSGSSLAQRQVLRDAEREAAQKRHDAYIAAGGVVYSTSLVTGAQSFSVVTVPTHTSEELFVNDPR